MPTRSLPPYRITATLAALFLSACGGGDGTSLTASMPQAPMAAALQPMTLATANTTAPSYDWSLAFSTPRIWHSMSTNTDGTLIVAGEAGGPIHVSRDGGATWTAGDSGNATWISSAPTATGDRIYAVQYGGAMYVTRDYGATWTPITNSNLVYSGSGLAYEAVAVSQDGSHIAAVIQNEIGRAHV